MGRLEDNKKVTQAMGALNTVSITLLVCVLGMLFLGVFLDRIFGTTPVFIVLGMIFGMFSGFISIYRFVMKMYPPKRKEEKEDD